MYHLTHYYEYPIYEPAEGGYYYSGKRAGEFYRLNSIKQVKRKFDKMKKELEQDGFVMNERLMKASLYSKYIGDGEHWIVEKVYGSHNSGWHPYE